MFDKSLLYWFGNHLCEIFCSDSFLKDNKVLISKMLPVFHEELTDFKIPIISHYLFSIFIMIKDKVYTSGNLSHVNATYVMCLASMK